MFFVLAQILIHGVKGSLEGSWILQRAVADEAYSQDFQSTEAQDIGGLHSQH